ncbi:MFS transporter [Brevibacillus brevis]|uniref:MFS transporter n=1 Tax=Brevibacillus brevis TaxID=1393 RepID=UPI00165D7092|nr:MFS transporter [Brevibacillus brevis]
MSRSEKRNRFIILAMALGLLMSSLDNTITSAAISHIIKDIGGFESMSWVFTSYVLAATSTMLIFGKMSDLFGRKLFYLLGITIFLIGSALCGVAQSIEQLIAFRALQGIGSGALFPITFTILFTLSSDPKYTARISGVFAGIFGLSSIAGPQVGTLLSDYLGWRWCFYVNVPIGLLSLLTLLFSLKESRSQSKPKIDYLGTVTLIVSCIAVMLALEWGGKAYEWSSWQIISLFALAIIVGFAFILVERHAQEPILPFQIFKNRMVVATCIACLSQGAIMFAAITYLPIFAVAVLGYPNSNSVLTPLMLSLTGGAVVFGMLQTKFSFRSLMAFSMLACVVSSILLMYVSTGISFFFLTLLMILFGFAAIGPLMSVAQNAIVHSVDKPYIGISSSIVGFCRNMGGVLGASITAAVVNQNYASIVSTGASLHGISLEKVADLLNPEVLMREPLKIEPSVHSFLSDSLGTAINHGYIVGLIFAVIGFFSVLYAGPGKLERHQKSVES